MVGSGLLSVLTILFMANAMIVFTRTIQFQPFHRNYILVVLLTNTGHSGPIQGPRPNDPTEFAYEPCLGRIRSGFTVGAAVGLSFYRGAFKLIRSFLRKYINSQP